MANTEMNETKVREWSYSAPGIPRIEFEEYKRSDGKSFIRRRESDSWGLFNEWRVVEIW